MSHRLTALLLLATSLVACAPYTPRIDVTTDPAVDLAAYSTFNFVDPLALEESGYAQAVSDEFQHVIGAALEQRGYRRSTEPDLLINIAAMLSADGDKQLQSDPYQTIHPQGGTFHESWRGYGHGYGASTQQSRYGDGTINVGIIRREDLHMVWEGVASGRLSGTRSETAWGDLIRSVTDELFAAFPQRTGEP